MLTFVLGRGIFLSLSEVKKKDWHIEDQILKQVKVE
jgi:hypothetical protein